MSLQRFDSVLNQLQKEAPRVFNALQLLSQEVKVVLENPIIQTIVTEQAKDNPVDSISELCGWKRDSVFRTIFLNDRLDFVSIGGASLPNGKLQVEEITNDHVAREVVTLKRIRQDTTPPNAAFGAYLSYRLQGFTVNSEPEAGRIQLIWEQNQTNDTTQRDSEMSFWTMADGVLGKKLTISSGGQLTLSGFYLPNKFLVTDGSGNIVTPTGLTYDITSLIAAFSSNHATNPQLHLVQNSTGDAYIRISLAGAVSFSLGIDNSDADKFKLSSGTAENAIPGTNDVFEVDTSNRLGFGVAASSTFKVRINKTAESTVLQLVHSDALTSPSEEIRQDSTGDASIRWQLAAGNSFILGIDNSDSDHFKLSYGASGNAALGTSDYWIVDISGRHGIGVAPSSTYKSRINKTAESTVLQLIHSDALTTPSLEMRQDSTGDVYARMQLAAGNSFSAGIDNSDGDFFKISYGASGNATPGTLDRIAIDLSGRIVIQGSTFVSGQLLTLTHFEEGPWIHCISTFVNPSIGLNNTGAGGQHYQIISTRTGGTGAAGAFVVRDVTAAANRLIIAPNGNFVVGDLAALATTATNGFLYIPSCAGTPTGVPTAFTGKIPLVYDSTNNILYARSGGAWRAH